MNILNILMALLCILVGVAITALYFLTIQNGEMDWWGRMGPKYLNEKHPCWLLAAGYWGLILGGFMLKAAMSSSEGIAVLMGGGIAAYLYLTSRY